MKTQSFSQNKPQRLRSCEFFPKEINNVYRECVMLYIFVFSLFKNIYFYGIFSETIVHFFIFFPVWKNKKTTSLLNKTPLNCVYKHLNFQSRRWGCWSRKMDTISVKMLKSRHRAGEKKTSMTEGVHSGPSGSVLTREKFKWFENGPVSETWAPDVYNGFGRGPVET